VMSCFHNHSSAPGHVELHLQARDAVNVDAK
jgi:hypothetical protein